MECKNVEEVLVDFFEDKLPKEEKEALIKHIELCEDCRKEADTLGKVPELVKRGFNLDREGLTAPDNLESLLRKALGNEGEREKSLGWRLKILGLAASVFIALLFIVINVSPAAAYYLHRIPVVEEFIEIGLIDKGLISAVEGDVGQRIEKSVTQYEITFTVHEVVATSNRTSVFYSIDYPEYINKMPDVPLFDGIKGLGFPFIKEGGVAHYDEANRRWAGVQEFEAISGPFSKVEVGFNRIVMGDQKVINGSWKISFYVDKDKAKGKEKRYVLNRAINGKGGSVTIKDIIVTAGETQVNYSLDENQDGFGSITLIDQNGKTYTGFSSDQSDTKGSIMFALTYPNKPAKIRVETMKEELSLDEEIMLDLDEKYPKSIDIDSALWEIGECVRTGNNIMVKAAVKEDPFEEIVKASIEFPDGTRSEWEREGPFLSGSEIEKVAKDKKAGFYQVLTFKNVDMNESQCTLHIERAVVYTEINEEIEIK